MPDWLLIPSGLLAGIVLLYGVWLAATTPSPLRRRRRLAPRSGRTDDYCAALAPSYGGDGGAGCGTTGGDGGQC